MQHCVAPLLTLVVLLAGALGGGLSPAGASRGPQTPAAPTVVTLPLVHRFAVGLATDDMAVLPLSRTLLLAQEAGKRALALDEGTGALRATIALPTGARHVAADPALGQIYLPDEFSGRLVVARLQGGWDHLVTQTVAVGRQPHGVAVDPRTHRVYVGNEHGNTLSIVDGLTLHVLATIPVGRIPGGVVEDPATSLVYVVLVGEDRVAVLDARSERVLRDVPVGAGPTHAALDPLTGRVAVLNTTAGTISFVDGRHGAASAPLPVGRAPYSLAADARTGLIFVASARLPLLTIVDDRRLAVRGATTLDMVPGAVAVDSTRDLLFLAGASRPQVEVFSFRGLR